MESYTMWAKGRGGRCHPTALMVKASPELSPESLSFLGEETVLNSGREVSIEWGWLSLELAGLYWWARLCV